MTAPPPPPTARRAYPPMAPPMRFGVALRRITLAALAAAAAGCDRSVHPTEALPALAPAAADAGAGAWRMLVLGAPDQILVPAPAPAASDAYRAELAAVKAAQAAMTPAQRRDVEYWSGGGVLRWNQVMRELVARHNLAPAPRADGSYPLPDAENPFADPGFPFASPPYAARAYSYVSVAQYEALKAAWHYKYRYGRPAPAKVDPGVAALAPAADLPAYPSEDAVLAGVTSEMLKLLFPASVEQITRLAAEEREAALVEEYLPEQLSDDELDGMVDDAVAEAGANSTRDMGRVMALVMPRVQGRADGKRVSAAVRARLDG